MPELPEVETVKRRLQEVVSGLKIIKIQSLHPKSFFGNLTDILQSTITDISRRDKLLRFHLDPGTNLLVHLKMTGQLIYVDDQIRRGGGHPTADWVKEMPGKHTRVIITFDNDAHLYFNDMRIFGWMKVMNDQAIAREYKKHGPDVIDDQFTAHYLAQRLRRRTIPIKQAIMINQIVGGIGNIYASEILFVAEIDPRRPANQLNRQELKKLVTVSKQVINEGIECGGTTFDGLYVDVAGLAGGYQDKLRVYGREGETCPGCGGEIQKVKISGRGTYFCPQCQN